jgi:hypothetical protein
MRNLVMSVLVVGLAVAAAAFAARRSLVRTAAGIDLCRQDEANAYVTYRRARVTYRLAYRRGYRRAAYYGGAYYRPCTYGHYRRVHRRVARRAYRRSYYY